MTFKELKEIMAKHNIPENVKLLSDSGWECGATEMNGVYYYKKDNYIVFTQDYGDNIYLNHNYKELK